MKHSTTDRIYRHLGAVGLLPYARTNAARAICRQNTRSFGASIIVALPAALAARATDADWQYLHAKLVLDAEMEAAFV